MKAQIYYNGQCGTARQTLEILKEHNCEIEIIEYLKTPLSEVDIRDLLKKTGLGIRDILRSKESIYTELNLGEASKTTDELIAALAHHPSLLNRPIVITTKGARVCRPCEVVLEIV